MSSPEPFDYSSQPPILSGGRRKSRFTHKHLAQLATYASTTPLRVIALIDLDAFYAQCETIRLDLPEEQPLAVQQWGGLIAVNYPARSAGCTRFIDMQEAKRLCPDLIFQHVATWKEGEDKWAYRDDSAVNVGSQKVSLDPYRKCSRDIFACIRDYLPASPLQRVEKASVDEVFLDLSAHVHSILIQRYSELQGPPPYDDPTEQLPLPPSTALDWQADKLVDLDTGETEQDALDWDDVVMLVASEIVRDVRANIREKLKFTCSGGISRNKMLAKLGAGYRKPNQQTVIRNRAVQQFLSAFKFTKIRNLGGKLGSEVITKFGTDEVKELLNVSLEQMKSKLGDDSGSWVYKAVRGEEHSEVNPRTQIKSMLSAKSFRPYINDRDTAVKWLQIFVADIYTRLVEEGVVENKRRPKTINLHYRHQGLTRSRQLPIPSGRKITQDGLLDLARTLLGQILMAGRLWPCANLSLSVGGFEDSVTGNHGIGAFLVKGNEAKAMNSSRLLGDSGDPDTRLPTKRQKVEGITKFLSKSAPLPNASSSDSVDREATHTPIQADRVISGSGHEDSSDPIYDAEDPGQYVCPQCQTHVPISEKTEHDDWHFAKALQADERTTIHPPPPPPSTKAKKAALPKGRGRPRKPAGGEDEARGQQKLVFGR